MTMTINNEHKKLNVPNLRFPEFEGEWEKKTIGEIATIKNGPFGSVLHAEDYVDETVLTLPDKRETGVSAVIYTQQTNRQFQLDIDHISRFC